MAKMKAVRPETVAIHERYAYAPLPPPLHLRKQRVHVERSAVAILASVLIYPFSRSGSTNSSETSRSKTSARPASGVSRGLASPNSIALTVACVVPACRAKAVCEIFCFARSTRRFLPSASRAIRILRGRRAMPYGEQDRHGL